MKGIKKILVGVIAVVMTFTLTSCGFVGNLIFGIFDSIFGGLLQEDISLEYTLTQDDLTRFTELVEKCEVEGMSESSLYSFSISLSEMTELLTYIETQSTVGYLEYCMNQTDPTALAHYTQSEDIYNSARTLYLGMLKKLEAESPLREQLFGGWSEDELKMLRVDNDKVGKLQLDTSELTRRFYELDEESETWSADVGVLYEQVVANNQLMAKEYGYGNYYALADELIYTRKYTTEQRTAFREYVGEYVVPMYADISGAYATAMGALTEAEQMELAEIYSNQEYLYGYMDSFDYSLKDKMYAMFERPNASLFGVSEDALEGAFTTYVSEFEQPIAYFGPGYDGLYTLVHELGHYAAYYQYTTSTLPFDLAETHSQGNEWLLTSYLKTKVSPNVYNALLLENLTTGLTTVVYSTLVDHFEELVYTAATPVKASEYSKLMDTVCASYEGLEGVASGLRYTPFEYAQRVTLTSPGYYLSYATSQVAAIGVYLLAEEQGYQAAVNAYTVLQEGIELDASFAEALGTAGLPSPFQAATFEKLQKEFWDKKQA